jgi:hypothetical protein
LGPWDWGYFSCAGVLTGPLEHPDDGQVPQAGGAHEAMAGDGKIRSPYGVTRPEDSVIDTRVQEIGITGGEEDGVNNESVDNKAL